MGIPTVTMTGDEHLSRVPDYLRLRSVVVIAPSEELLRRWQAEGRGDEPAPSEPPAGLTVDVPGRRLSWVGAPLPLTDLEFRVAACLAAEPGRAWSFLELRRAGWGDGPALDVDVFAVRSVIQRIRGKLRVAGATPRLVSVRSFGFRLDLS
jgi:DNA-binding response OmpR family regulator